VPPPTMTISVTGESITRDSSQTHRRFSKQLTLLILKQIRCPAGVAARPG